jgi:gamma-glutamyl hercynylcysteine S-oxide hydrolase
MCRLFAYVHSGSARSMRETLGVRVLNEFRQLAEVHRDGWGAVWVRSKNLSSYVTINSASRDETMFDALTTVSVDSAIVHERWASPGIGLSLDNQQPFATNGVAFAHNGTIGNEDGNIVQRPAPYRGSLGLVSSTTMSDSRIYADLFFLRLDELQLLRQTRGLPPSVDEVRQALAISIGQLREDYPDASFNNVIETADFTFATQAHAVQPKASPGLRRGYEKAGWAHRIDSYYELVYTSLTLGDGSVTSAVSSSGYPASDSWTRPGNNALLVLSHRDASIQTLPLNG